MTIMAGIEGMRSKGTATVTFGQSVEAAIALNAENFVEKLPKDRFNSKSNPLNQYEGTIFERLALFAGFTVESKIVDSEGLSTYTLFLKEFWLPQTPKFLASVVSLGAGLGSGFTDISDSFCWFYSSKIGSQKMEETGYSY